MKDWGGMGGSVAQGPELSPDCLGVIWLGEHAPELRCWRHLRLDTKWQRDRDRKASKAWGAGGGEVGIDPPQNCKHK